MPPHFPQQFCYSKTTESNHLKKKNAQQGVYSIKLFGVSKYPCCLSNLITFPILQDLSKACPEKKQVEMAQHDLTRQRYMPTSGSSGEHENIREKTPNPEYLPICRVIDSFLEHTAQYL